MSEALLRTPLHGEHVAFDAKMVPFAGYEMPVHYPTGIREEHQTVRETAGLFDVSHMGEFRVRGPEALALVQRLAVNDASTLQVGQAQYSAMCREDGGVLDDLLVYHYEDHYMLVVNAANRSRDLEWVEEHAEGFDAVVEDHSDQIALLALQGPVAEEVLAPLADRDLPEIGYYRFESGHVAGRPATISRTGYTGEDGFELYVAAEDARTLWRTLLGEGTGAGLGPAGLGARDSLRLEMGYALYGNDLDERHTPLEAGLGWITKLDKGEFVGRDALRRQKEAGVERRLVGLRLTERGFPRPGYDVVADDRDVGTVTSGTVSPSLGVGIAMAWVPAGLAAPDTGLGVRIRDRVVPAVVQRPPFYTEGSLKR